MDNKKKTVGISGTSDPSFVGTVASAIANGPYSDPIIYRDMGSMVSKRYIGGSYNHMRCKVCGKSEHVTLCKDGDSYICTKCKSNIGE